MRPLPLILAVLLMAGCASQTTALRMEGFNAQWQAFRSVSGEPFGILEATIKVRVVVVERSEDMPYVGAAGTYSEPGSTIHVIGKMVGGKIVLPESVIGHELIHAIQFQAGWAMDPDTYKLNGL